MYYLIASCHFGLESVLKQEITKLGYEIVLVEDGRITFCGGPEAIARANIWLRTAERILLQIGKFHAETFDELFDGMKTLPWEEFIPVDGKVWVAKAASVKSKLFSPVDIQSISKKAIVEKLKETYHQEVLSESGESFPLRLFIRKDEVVVGLDTTGTGLHKRGYRLLSAKAPISETLASALIQLTPWNESRILVDPFCGSGTFVIEAALMACNIAPGMNREFLSQVWPHIANRRVWYEAFDEARSSVNMDKELMIQGYDIDENVIRAARDNAKAAGVEDLIHLQRRAVKDLSHPKKYGFIITNPPYGERIDDEQNIRPLYEELGEQLRTLDSWSAFVITSFEGIEEAMGRKATRNRKIYNGMIKTYFYQFLGDKPPKRQAKDSIV